MSLRILLIYLFWMVSLTSHGQHLPWSDTRSGDFQSPLGGRIGLQITLGQPINRVGMVFNLFYQKDWIQVNSEWRGHYNFSAYGPKGKSWESRTTIGLIAAIGDSLSGETNPFVDVLLHQTKRSFALGYAYRFYHDNRQTSQGSGSLALHFKNFYILTENDMLGSTVGKDRFRTGAFAFGYRYDRWLYELTTVLWTGQTRGENTQTYRGEQAGNYPARWGYRDISKALYGDCSHGVVAGRVQYALPYGQIAQATFGVDDERIRNFVQNKLIHDMYFFPSKWTTVRNLHFPMLDCEGNAYCYRDDQSVRPLRWVYQLGLNGMRFY